MEKIKTIHENKVLINPPIESITDKMQILQVLNNMRTYILSLPRYEYNINSGGQDCWCTMDEGKEGEWIKLQDALKLFVVENE